VAVWSVLSATVALAVLSIWLLAARGSDQLINSVSFAFFSLAVAPVGALIAVRRPSNGIGWILLALGLDIAATSAAAVLSRAGDADALAFVLRFMSNIGWAIGVALLGWFLLLFPDGRLPSRRWRPLAWAVAAWPVALLTAAVLAPTTISGGRTVPNPLGGVGGPLGDVLTLAVPLLFAAVVPLFGAVAVATLVRFARSSGPERQQLKWFAYAVILCLLAVFVSLAMSGFGVALNFALYSLPVATAFAILRHRLYDIDLLINRTLVYGALTAALAATYFGAVALLQTALRPLTGESEFAVAGSTLAVVALFAPLRRRIQGVVDRRFYRSRYDAARTLDAFGARLRDQVDLDAVERQLLGVVRETLQPAHASLWLRERVR
jgi:hypothetical protein